jgi:hypothetical protein
MTADAVAAALEEVRFDARQDSRHEHLAANSRGHAELAEWERIDQLLAAAGPGTVYDPDTDDVARAELAADAAAAAPSCAKPPGSRPAPMSSRRCANPARGMKPCGTCSPGPSDRETLEPSTGAQAG